MFVLLMNGFKLRTFSVRSSFPCVLSCLQEEPHRGQQGWLDEGSSLALDAQPGSPQVPGEVVRLSRRQDGIVEWLPRSYNPQSPPALGLLGLQIGLQAGHRRCQHNRQTEKQKVERKGRVKEGF